MALCVLGYNPLIYNNYGCWCGSGGSNEPVDEIDRCCMIHDKCYDALVDNKTCCSTINEYVSTYDWDCENNRTAICKHIQAFVAPAHSVSSGMTPAGRTQKWAGLSRLFRRFSRLIVRETCRKPAAGMTGAGQVNLPLG
ncbi:hypothetical protein Y032_0002g581 [Ancylostoma ceylanicum]|nr:hypothetical protein Y032_0002g581 [Ancylostoma ceylanicum]